MRVTGVLAGFPTATQTSAPTARVATGRLDGEAPRVTGPAKVGGLLKASTVRWSPAPVTLRYQWYAGGDAIRRARTSTLRVKGALVGKRLRVRVTATKPGYRTVVVTSPWTARVTRR